MNYITMYEKIKIISKNKKETIRSLCVDGLDSTTKIINKSKNVPELSDTDDDSLIDKSLFNKNMSDSKSNIVNKNISIKDKLMTIDKIIEMYPNLKKDRDTIVNNVLGKKEKRVDVLVLEKVSFKDVSFYKDPAGNLLDINTQLIGLYIETETDNIYYLFDDLIKINKKIVVSGGELFK